jgi:hypothetical protein
MINPETIITGAAERFAVSDGADSSGRGRSGRITRARQAVAVVLHNHDSTLVEIGAMMRPDHTTICEMLKRARPRTANDWPTPRNARRCKTAHRTMLIGDGCTWRGPLSSALILRMADDAELPLSEEQIPDQPGAAARSGGALDRRMAPVLAPSADRAPGCALPRADHGVAVVPPVELALDLHERRC